MANRMRREGYDYAFTADQEGTTWDWAQRTRFRATTRWKQFRAEFELQGANSGEDAETDVVGSDTFSAANVQQLFVSANSTQCPEFRSANGPPRWPHQLGYRVQTHRSTISLWEYQPGLRRHSLEIG